MVTIDDNVARAIRRAQKVYGTLTVRCGGCGHNWKHKEGNDLHCRFCAGSGKPQVMGSMIHLGP